MTSTDDSSQFDSKAFLATVTQQPGIYQMLDEQRQILYVGKAKNLKKRLASYFRKQGLPPKTRVLVSKICHVEVTVTETETEALLLEQNLIKQQRPPYNILLRDDKSYPYIFLSDHEYPRLTVHRGAKRAKGQYYGPYPNATAVRDSLNFLQKIFKVRQCENSFFSHRTRPCLQYQIKRCTAPCVKQIDAPAYAESVRHTVMFLEGKSRDLITELADSMERAASALEFEQAAEYRDRIQHLQQIQARQYIEGEQGDLDIIAADQRVGAVCVQQLFVRGGRVLGSKSYWPKLPLDSSLEDVLEAFIAQYYLANNSAREIPREILVSHALPGVAVLKDVLERHSPRQVAVTHRVRSHRAKWLKLAQQTATQNLNSFLANKQSLAQRFEALQDALKLPESLKRMECFDISHSSGEATVASCVVFDQSGPLKSDYRRFNIEDVQPGDDYAAMRQALSRRYTRIKAGEGAIPDILFIDGGKGQVRQAREVLEELQLDELLIVGVAKGTTRKAGFEILVRADTQQEFTLPSDSPALHLVQHIRDESHRFAITGHKQRRDKKRRQSPLEGIPGVGPKRRRQLLRHFGGWQEVSSARVEDLAKIPGISEKLAKTIYAALHNG